MRARPRRRRTPRARPSEALLLAVEHLPYAVFVKDADELRYIGCNQAAEELLGFATGEMLGKNDHDLLPESEADAVRAEDREVLASGGGTHDFPAQQIWTRHRGTRIVHTRKLPVFDPDGNAVCLVGISEDITEREHADALLSTAQHQADSANRLKSEFLSRMSHELRTPLNAVLGFAQLLEMDDLSTEQDANLRHITRAGSHLLDLVNQVLEISESETGRLAISLEPIGVTQAIADAVALVDAVAEAHGVHLSSERTGDVDVFVRADHQRLLQVLVNLLTNAIKYGGDGGVVSLTITTPEPGWLRVTVGDDGPGIEPSLIDRLFTPFDRLGAEQGSIEGTGLGLALVKAFVEAMGGRVDVDTTPGHGSRFSLDLVLAEAPRCDLDPEVGDAEPPGASYATGSVLYIEDHVSNVELVELALERRPSLELLVATNGRDGVARADAELPNLVLLDLNLGDLPGQEVLRLLKANPRTARIPVVIVTADASTGRAQELLTLGADRYITKPLDLNHLLATVDSFIALGTKRA
jgi:PAS domain S-box-containing protein